MSRKKKLWIIFSIIGVVLIIIAIAVPVAVFVPKKGKNDESTTTVKMSTKDDLSSEEFTTLQQSFITEEGM